MKPWASPAPLSRVSPTLGKGKGASFLETPLLRETIQWFWIDPILPSFPTYPYLTSIYLSLFYLSLE